MSMLLVVNGKDSSDIFKSLVSLMYTRVAQLYGETIIIQCRKELEEMLRNLAVYFREFSILFKYSFDNEEVTEKYHTTSLLKDYKLWLRLRSSAWLCISFDYCFTFSRPEHLE
jgi:hypothetical protein